MAADREAPPKQRHTATRVYQRLVSEHGYTGAAVTVRLYVSQQRRRSGLLVEQSVEVQLHAQQLEVFHRGRRVASHERLPDRFGERLLLDHYLELL